MRAAPLDPAEINSRRNMTPEYAEKMPPIAKSTTAALTENRKARGHENTKRNAGVRACAVFCSGLGCVTESFLTAVVLSGVLKDNEKRVSGYAAARIILKRCTLSFAINSPRRFNTGFTFAIHDHAIRFLTTGRISNSSLRIRLRTIRNY